VLADKDAHQGQCGQGGQGSLISPCSAPFFCSGLGKANGKQQFSHPADPRRHRVSCLCDTEADSTGEGIACAGCRLRNKKGAERRSHSPRGRFELQDA
jgi:hypothetical protein